MAQLQLVDRAPFDLEAPQPRPDHHVIAHMVKPNASVLDVGCGDGALMSLLSSERKARTRGLEIARAQAQACVARGLSVVQGDAEADLGEFPSASFDYVIFSHSLQHLRQPEAALRQAARIGDRVIVSIANAAFWRARFGLLLGGRLGPVEAPHRYTLRDFVDQARAARLAVETATPLSRGRQGAPFARTLWRANWFAQEAVFLLAS